MANLLSDRQYIIYYICGGLIYTFIARVLKFGHRDYLLASNIGNQYEYICVNDIILLHIV